MVFGEGSRPREGGEGGAEKSGSGSGRGALAGQLDFDFAFAFDFSFLFKIFLVSFFFSFFFFLGVRAPMPKLGELRGMPATPRFLWSSMAPQAEHR